MRVLSLDTTGAYCACALVDAGRILGQASEKIGRGHAERLAPMTQEMLSGAGAALADIDQIAVCTGPGSFTGLRVALAFAKGLALPRKIPVIGMSALEVHAARMDPQLARRIAVFTDVRRGELCFQIFENGLALTPPLTEAADEAQSFIAAQDAHISELKGPISTALLGWLSMEASSQSHPAEPLYSRAPDAKLPGGIDP